MFCEPWFESHVLRIVVCELRSASRDLQIVISIL